MNSTKLFKEGYNCAQSVFVPLAIDNNIEKESAFKIMSPYGGGLAKTNNICGALSGGISAIGLHFGHAEANDLEAKQKCMEATQRFIKAFKNKHQHTNCTELINYNLSNETEAKEAAESGVFDTKCPKYVETAYKLAKEIIDELN